MALSGSKVASNDGADIPPHHKAFVGQLKTFELPSAVGTDQKSVALGKALIDTWRKDGILQIKMTQEQGDLLRQTYEVSKAFFKLPHAVKAKHVDDQSYAGYIASGEEVTDGIADYSEIFTVFKDLPASDPRVQDKWPCHGPCPWPSPEYEDLMKQLMSLLGDSGEKLLKLVGLGLGLKDPDTLLHLTKDGWHHMRVLRFPQVDKTNGRGKVGRGIGSHTDYGLLVIASQTNVGGLFVRPTVPGEDSIHNWEKSAAGLHEDDEKWMFVPPVENTLTVFPGKHFTFPSHGLIKLICDTGDMMQFITSGYLPSTPHKVGLNTRERFAFAYFHEPNFSANIRPLPEVQESIHYGTHITNMCLRNYPDRITTKRLEEEHRMQVLAGLRSMAKQAQYVS